MARRPVKAAALLQTARELESRGQLGDAVASYQKALTQEPSNLDALLQLGRIQLQQNQFEPSEKALRRVVSLRPQHAIGQSLLGMVLARTGRGDKAVTCFERALAAEPRSELVLLHYADTLGTLGRHADSIATFDKALAINPNNLIAWNNRGLALEALGRDAEAADSFGRALALRPGTPQIHFSLGNALYRLERYEDAADHYRRTAAAWPTFARAHANLGNALAKLEQWDAALQSLTRAANLKSDASPAELAQLHIAIANTLRKLQRDQDSLPSIEKALEFDPGNADIIARKAHTLFLLGRLEDARKLAEQAIDLKPDWMPTYVTLAQIKRLAADDPAIAQMETLLADSRSQPTNDVANLHFATGKAYDDIGEFDRAFAHFAAGNQIKRRNTDYDEEREFRDKSRIEEIFSPEMMNDKAGQGETSDQPIFIIGMPRSGTTLVEQIIASHPLVFGAGEQTAFSASVTADEIRKVGSDYLARMNRIVPNQGRFTDKMPDNYNYAGLIHLALPNAKIVHVRRNPLDSCLSMFSTNFENPPKYAHDLGELGRYYRRYQQLMAHWRTVLPEDAMIDVRYEEVVDDIEGQARRLIAFCGLDWDDACLAFHKRVGTVRTASAFQVRQPIYRRSMERWRNYEKHLAPLIAALGDASVS
jgi:tetratricopeptide (TPR) repeat protein